MVYTQHLLPFWEPGVLVFAKQMCLRGWIKTLMWQHPCQASLRRHPTLAVTVPYWDALCDAVGLLALSSPLLLSLSPSHWNLGWCPVPSLLTHHQHPSSLRTQHRPEPNTACRLSILGKHKYMVKHKYKCITMLFNKLKNSSRTALTFQLWMQGC